MVLLLLIYSLVKKEPECFLFNVEC